MSVRPTLRSGGGGNTRSTTSCQQAMRVPRGALSFLKAGSLILFVPAFLLSVLFVAGCQRPPAAVAQVPGGAVAITAAVVAAPATAAVNVGAPPTAQPASPSPEPTATSSPTPVPSPTPSGPPLKRTENILVMSVDHRKTDPDPSWRTDSIIVVAVDHAANRVGLINIPRDLYVDIPGMGKGRINQADYYGEETKYPGGGPALIGRVLSDTLGIPTQHWARIQFDGLTRMVDALGGITVTLDCPLYERGSKESAPNGVEEFYLPAGTNYLDGATAKKFATWRYVESDFGRTKRQQQVIWAIRQRALQINAIPHIPAMWQALSDVFTTDLGVFDAIKLATLGAKLQPKDVHSVVLDLNAVDYYWTEEGASVLIVKDKAQLQRELDAVWGGQSVAALGTVAQKSECPPPPTPVPTYTPRPTITPTPTGTITSTLTVTGTVSVTATVTPTVQSPGDALSTPSPSPTPTGTPTATPGT